MERYTRRTAHATLAVHAPFRYCGGMADTTWVYKRTEPTLWTVGYYDPNGQWEPESDHGNPTEAAERVHWLNGGGHE